ncbi:hypothetical protein DMUE_1082 [Dictyocoela muelleri]|nr:hypothetical protein DMUE_1082 [Dictyocoela muelleri]
MLIIDNGTYELKAGLKDENNKNSNPLKNNILKFRNAIYKLKDFISFDPIPNSTYRYMFHGNWIVNTETLKLTIQKILNMLNSDIRSIKNKNLKTTLKLVLNKKPSKIKKSLELKLKINQSQNKNVIDKKKYFDINNDYNINNDFKINNDFNINNNIIDNKKKNSMDELILTVPLNLPDIIKREILIICFDHLNFRKVQLGVDSVYSYLYHTNRINKNNSENLKNNSENLKNNSENLKNNSENLKKNSEDLKNNSEDLKNKICINDDAEEGCAKKNEIVNNKESVDKDEMKIIEDIKEHIQKEENIMKGIDVIISLSHSELNVIILNPEKIIENYSLEIGADLVLKYANSLLRSRKVSKKSELKITDFKVALDYDSSVLKCFEKLYSEKVNEIKNEYREIKDFNINFNKDDKKNNNKNDGDKNHDIDNNNDDQNNANIDEDVKNNDDINNNFDNDDINNNSVNDNEIQNSRVKDDAIQNIETPLRENNKKNIIYHSKLYRSKQKIKKLIERIRNTIEENENLVEKIKDPEKYKLKIYQKFYRLKRKLKMRDILKRKLNDKKSIEYGIFYKAGLGASLNPEEQNIYEEILNVIDSERNNDLNVKSKDKVLNSKSILNNNSESILNNDSNRMLNNNSKNNVFYDSKNNSYDNSINISDNNSKELYKKDFKPKIGSFYVDDYSVDNFSYDFIDREYEKMIAILSEIDPDFIPYEITAIDVLNTPYLNEIDIFRITEAIFEPSIIGMSGVGLLEIFDEIKKFNIEKFFVTGGFSNLKNFRERVKKEISSRFPDNVKIIFSDCTSFDTFYGACFSNYFPVYEKDEYLRLGAEELIKINEN